MSSVAALCAGVGEGCGCCGQAYERGGEGETAGKKIGGALAPPAGLTHQCLYFEQPHTFEQILFIQTAEPALVGHA